MEKITNSRSTDQFKNKTTNHKNVPKMHFIRRIICICHEIYISPENYWLAVKNHVGTKKCINSYLQLYTLNTLDSCLVTCVSNCTPKHSIAFETCSFHLPPKLVPFMFCVAIFRFGNCVFHAQTHIHIRWYGFLFVYFSKRYTFLDLLLLDWLEKKIQ